MFSMFRWAALSTISIPSLCIFLSHSVNSCLYSSSLGKKGVKNLLALKVGKHLFFSIRSLAFFRWSSNLIFLMYWFFSLTLWVCSNGRSEALICWLDGKLFELVWAIPLSEVTFEAPFMLILVWLLFWFWRSWSICAFWLISISSRWLLLLLFELLLGCWFVLKLYLKLLCLAVMFLMVSSMIRIWLVEKFGKLKSFLRLWLRTMKIVSTPVKS